MVKTKILGWLLLVFGILIIFYSLFSSWNIFTGKSLPPEIFKIEKVTPPASLEKQTEAEKIVQEQLQKQFQEIIPAGSIPQLLNLISWSILVTIFIFGGAQISGLGIRLIKR